MYREKLLNIIKLKLSGFLTQNSIELLLKVVKSELKRIYISNRVINNLSRILENDYYIQAYASDIEILKIYLKIIINISAFSNYLTDIVVRNPEYLTEFLTSDGLLKQYNRNDFENEILQRLNIFKSVDKKINALIRFRRQHILRIGLKDILGFNDFYNISKEYSSLTKSILDQAFKLALASTTIETKVRIPSYCLVALGKLGGDELNYSSDVDLICVFDSTTDEYSSEVIEYYDKVVKNFINICTTNRDAGYLYRLDFRLRPDGKYSPLARSISYYQIYYDSSGREWERQMLLRANYVSGDLSLYEKFKKISENFIYQAYTSPNILLNRMKFYNEQVFDNQSLFDHSRNVKYFYGGIRNIEFATQALQIIYGHHYSEIRTGNTLDALSQLYKLHLITNKTYLSIKNAYEFLRKIENFIQLMDDRQVHVLPIEKEKIENLCKYLQLKNQKIFKQKLKHVKQNVINYYESIFNVNQVDDALEKLIRKIKFNDRKNSEVILTKATEYVITKLTSSPKLSEQFNLTTFQKQICNYLKNAEDADKCLKNFYKVIKKIISVYQLGELVLDVDKLKTTLMICDNSEMLFNSLMINDAILDFFSSGKTFKSLEDTIEIINYSSFELELLRFYLSINFLMKNFNAKKLSVIYASFFDEFLKKIIRKSLKDFQLNDSDFCLIALGSYGSKELQLRSDLDVVFIFNDWVIEEKAEKFSNAILETFRSSFNALDYIHIDSRLKPEGSVSKLGWSISEFSKYINQRMRVWELMAYSDSRYITGNESLYFELINTLHAKIKSFDFKILAHEIDQAIKKYFAYKINVHQGILDVKNSFGGITDIRFFRQKLKLLIVNSSNININDIAISSYDNKNLIELVKKTKTLSQLKTIDNLLSIKDPDFSNEKKYRVNFHKKIVTKDFIKTFNKMGKYHQLFSEFILLGNVLFNKKNLIINKDYNNRFTKKFFRIGKSQNILAFFKESLINSQKTLEKLNKELFDELD